MKDKIVLLTKDAMCKSYLPIYGGKRWKGETPNVDELAEKGTVFTNCYTAAPSTAMSFLGIFTGRFPYELDIHDYTPMKKEFKDNLFRRLEIKGYKCHIIWDSKWDSLAKPYSNCYGNAVFHSINNLGQPVGARFPHEGKLVPNNIKADEVIAKLRKEITEIIDNGKLFLWIHLPHVISGRISYGGDIDIYDNIVGMIREYFSDDAIFLSADHGNMAGTHGKVGYGFDVYQSAIAVPLITPRIDSLKEYSEVFTTVDLGTMITENRIKTREYIYVDTAYYKQPHRKLAVIHKNYHYIYNKQTRLEELYDIEYDPLEGINLFSENIFDKERKSWVPIRDLLPYEKWDELEEEKEKLIAAKEKIWRRERVTEAIFWKIRHMGGIYVDKISSIYVKTKHRSI